MGVGAREAGDGPSSETPKIISLETSRLVFVTKAAIPDTIRATWLKECALVP